MDSSNDGIQQQKNIISDTASPRHVAEVGVEGSSESPCRSTDHAPNALVSRKVKATTPPPRGSLAS